MRRIGFAALFGALGFAIGAGATGLLVSMASSNTHDLSLEVVMTAFFVGGPLGGLIGAVVGFVRARPRPQ